MRGLTDSSVHVFLILDKQINFSFLHSDVSKKLWGLDFNTRGCIIAFLIPLGVCK